MSNGKPIIAIRNVTSTLSLKDVLALSPELSSEPQLPRGIPSAPKAQRSLR